VSLLVRLSDWSDAGKIQSLVAALKPVLTGRDREQTLAQILDATGQVNATIRTRVLVSVGQPTDRAVVSALADAVLQNTAVRELLPEGMTAAVDREMTSALDGEPERVRRILSYRAARAKTDVEREALTDVLERSMGHASARVRMHAHRLLRTHAERPRYLAATRPLLRDGDAATVRSAIRVLAFGGDVDSVAEIADLLSHSQAVVRNAARDGLVHLGAEAVPLLTKAMGRARPDRREAYAGVLERIRSGLGADVLDEDDGQETDRS
jgi:HEAT repeat protein